MSRIPDSRDSRIPPSSDPLFAKQGSERSHRSCMVKCCAMPGVWNNFMITAAEAAAALTGLVIVAISVNLTRILSFKHLPARAGSTVASLILTVVTGMATLVPQRLPSLGREVAAFAIVCWLLHLHTAQLTLAARREHNRPPAEIARVIVLGQAQTLSFVVGGILLATGHEVGFYWLAGGIIATFIFSTFMTWVLLVEILR